MAGIQASSILRALEQRPVHYDEKMQTKRYRPGQIPEWASVKEEIEIITQTTTVEAPRVGAVVDRRLARLQQRQRTTDRSEALQRHRHIHQAQVLEPDEVNDDDDNSLQWRKEGGRSRDEISMSASLATMEMDDDANADEDTRFQRRQAIRERIRERQAQEAEKKMPAMDRLQDEDDEESDEWETDTDDSEEDQFARRRMLKPVFIPKTERDTVKEKEKIAEQETAIETGRVKRLKERKEETRQIIQEEIVKERQLELQGGPAVEAASDDEEMPDTDDDQNEAEEYDQWKLRELRRIKRDREERDAMLKEREEVERRRNLTDAERRAEDRQYDAAHPKPSKKKWNFLQKYYHKGAFFMDTTEKFEPKEAIYKRDYGVAVGEDKLDKSILPKVMQVKHFGRSGRTKYTHLVDQDTTVWDSAWASNNDLRAKYNNKMAGVGELELRPARKKSRTG